MFPKNSKEIVLIGEPYRSKESFSLLDSKIGGLPLWFTNIPKEYPFHCKGCGQEMRLAVQLYEPTDELDRVLYIFCCPSSQCQLASTGWICIRQQQPIPEEEEMPETPKETLDSKSSKSSKSSKPASSGFGLSWDFGSSAGDNSLFGGDMDIMAMLNKMEKKETQKSKPAPSAVVTPVEAKPSVTPKISPGIPITDSQRPKFPEYFLDIYDEPAEKKQKQKAKHMQPVEDLEDVMEGGGQEVYDKDKGMAKLIKFNAALKRAPSQVLRIAYPGGSPLLSSNKPVPAVPACKCGCVREFEVQLLPTLLSFIMEEEEEDLLMGEGGLDLSRLRDDKEWSSVFIYTCGESCENHQEHVIVMES